MDLVKLNLKNFRNCSRSTVIMTGFYGYFSGLFPGSSSPQNKAVPSLADRYYLLLQHSFRHVFLFLFNAVQTDLHLLTSYAWVLITFLYILLTRFMVAIYKIGVCMFVCVCVESIIIVGKVMLHTFVVATMLVFLHIIIAIVIMKLLVCKTI